MGGLQEPSEDERIIAAFDDWVAPKWVDADAEIADHARMREVDRIIGHGIPTTPIALAKKLRVALFCEADSDWMKSLSFGASIPDVEARMRQSDFVAQILWSAIQSLEQMEMSA